MNLALSIFTTFLVISFTLAQNEETVQVCKSKADVVAVLDSSGSVGEKDYEELKNFVGFVANLLTLNENGNRLGVVTYSEDAEVDFNLNEIYDADRYASEAMKRLSVRPNEFKTNHYAGLKVGSDLLNNTAAGAREDAVKFLIFTTDGRNNFEVTNDRNRALRLANRLKDDGVNIYVIKAEVMSDNNGRLDSRQYSTDPNRFYKFINNFGEITNDNFLDEVGLQFCQLVRLPGNQVANVREDRNIGHLVLTIEKQGLENPMFELVPQDNLPFVVDPLTGEVKTIALLDFEKIQQYNFQVKVRSTNPQVEKFINVTVNVLDVNDNDPMPESAMYRTSVAETMEIGRSILTVKANDPDSGMNGQVNYFLISGGDGKFEVDQSTGEVRLIGKLNKREKESYVLNIEARDNGVPERMAPITVNIDVTSLNNFTPQFSEQSFQRTIPENFGTGTVIDASASDGDGDMMVYSLIGDNLPFSIDQTGKITVSGNIDFETITNNVFQFQVKVEANGDVTTKDAQITITDINDNTPTYTLPTYSGSIVENSATGTVVDLDNVIKATDADKTNANNLVTYNIIAGNTGDRFQVTKNDMGNAVISLKSTPLDRESQSQYTLTVQAIDNGVDPGTLESSAQVIIDVVDQNDNDPVPTQNIYTMTVAETTPTGQSILTVNADDPDSGMNGKVEYILVSGGDGKFELDRTTGEITLIGKLNKREKEQYMLNIEARDMGVPMRKARILANIRVTSLNNFTPQFTEESFERTIPEDFKGTVFNAAATDDDGDMITYSLIGDNLPFSIDQNGLITVSGNIDFETIPNNVIRFQIKSEASGDMTVKDAAVTITDINDNTPKFSIDIYAGKIDENSEEETKVEFEVPIKATDGDKTNANNIITYSIIDGNVDNIFKIVKNDQGEAVISVSNAGLDRENQSKFNLTIQAIDNGVNPSSLQSTAEVIIDVEDVNDVPPGFRLVGVEEVKAVGDAKFTGTIPENSPIGLSVLQVEAVDPDSNEEDLRFRLEDTNVPFKIDEKTGLITVDGPIDAETKDSYTVPVTVSDGINESTTVTMIEITDKNDNRPLFTTASRDSTIPLDSPVGQEIIRFTGSDADITSPNNDFEFSLVNGDDKPFSVDKNGSLTVNGPLMPGNYILTVKIMDNGTDPGALSNMIVYNVNVVDTNEPPFFSENERNVQIAEDTPDGTEVFTFTASDPNGDAVKYEIVNQGSVPFTIDENTGVITKTGSIDFESPVRSYPIEVKATDSRGKSTIGKINFEITDVNDNTPTFGAENRNTLMVMEGEYSNQMISSFVATDMDATSPNNQIEYTLVGAPSVFSITTNPNTMAGDLSLNGNIDAEQDRSYNFIVRATDKGNPALSMDYPVTIQVGDVNDNAPTFAADSTDSFMIMEGEYANQIISSFSATDMDATSPNNEVEYTLVGAPSIFSLRTDPGTMTADLVLDGNVDADGLENSYDFVIRATDKGNPALTRDIPITIAIKDVNDNAPTFSLGNYEMALDENTAIGSSVLKVMATDDDSGANSEITYRIIGGDGTFSIDERTGEIRLIKDVDYEKIRSYEFEVEASDNGNPKQSMRAKVRININNLNDNNPVFITNPMVGSVNENEPAGTVVMNIDTSDKDNDQTRVTILREPPPGAQSSEGFDFDAPFEIDPETGEVRTLRSLDFEEEREFNMMVKSSDGERETIGNMTVRVINMNDNNPQMDNVAYRVTIKEDEPIGSSLLRVQATDVDQENQKEITYSILNVAGGNMDDFKIDPVTGIITLNTDLKKTNTRMYNLTIQAEDKGPGPTRTSRAVAVFDILRPASIEPDSTTLCSCDVPDKRYECLDYSKYVITRKFNGSCYVDKLKSAIEDVKNTTKEVMNMNSSFIDCRNRVKAEITDPNTDFPIEGLFDLYRKCTVSIECKLERIAFNMKRKATELTDQLKSEEDGFSYYDMSLSAFFNHISKMMSMSKSSRMD